MPSVIFILPTVATTTAPVPTDRAVNRTTYCGKYYQAVLGNFSNMIVIKFRITMDDFLFLNPAVNINCTNLFAFESYCVAAVGDINTYSGRHGASTATPTGVQTTAKFVSLPNVTTTASYNAPTLAPMANGTHKDCASYFLDDLFQASAVNGIGFVSTCDFAAQTFYVDLSDFGTWNTDIYNTSLSTCSFKKGVRYCGKLFFGQQPPAPDPTSDLPIRAGASKNFTQFADATDGHTCAEILAEWSLTIAQFYQYNPAVGSGQPTPECCHDIFHFRL